MIAAILRAHLLSMRIGASRGRIFGLITGVLWYGLWTVVALGCGIYLAKADRETLSQSLPLGFLLVCFYWQVVPVLTASMGSGLDLRKLLVYPVPRPRLFAVEILLRLASNLEMVLVLTGGLAGLLVNWEAGGITAAPRIAIPLLLFLVFNLLLGSGVRSLLERLLSRRRVREVVVLFMVILWMLPRLIIESDLRPKSLDRFAVALEAIGLPWSAASHAALGPSGWQGVLSLAAWVVVAFWFARAQFARTLRYDIVAAQATPLVTTAPEQGNWKERFYRLPSAFLRDPLAGIVEKELRSLARTPRFRTVFIMGFTFGLMVWFPTMIGRHRSSGASSYFLVVVCVYALTLLGQVTYWNCFGFDRSAAAFYFAAPQPISTALLGKNIAALFYIYFEAVIVTGVTAALGLSGGWQKALEAFVVVGVCSLYMLALGNVSSVQYPRSLSPERNTQGGASGRFQGMIFLLYPVALIPVLLAYLARYALNSDLAFAMVLGVAAIIGGVLYWIGMESAVGTARKRRESILQELSQGEGPVVSG